MKRKTYFCRLTLQLGAEDNTVLILSFSVKDPNSHWRHSSCRLSLNFNTPTSKICLSLNFLSFNAARLIVEIILLYQLT